MTVPEPSGADLARVALMAARKNAKTAPVNPRAARKKRTTARRGDGRDPITLATAIGRLVEDRAWETPAAGGTILDQWATICPELVGKVTAEHYDPETGILHLRPASPAYATQLRMFGRQLVDRINAKAGSTVVRAIRVLAPGAPSRTAEAGALEEPTPAPTVPAQPRSRADAPPGYHRALQAARAAQQTPPDDPTKPARDRMFGPTRDTLREPETAFTDALETAAAASGGNDPEQVRQAAIQRARDQKAGRTPSIPTAFARTA